MPPPAPDPPHHGNAPMNRRPPRRLVAPRPQGLEARRLLAISAAYVGLDTLDVAGPTAAIGPGGFRNLHVQVTIPAGTGGALPTLRALDVAGPGGFRWSFGTTGAGGGNPQANPAIAVAAGVVAADGKSERFDAYFSPVVAAVDPATGATATRALGNNQPLTLTVAYAYAGGPIATESAATNPALVVTPRDLDQPLADPAPALPAVAVGTFAATYRGQGADGMGHVVLAGLPAGSQVVPGTAELSDAAGLYWDAGSSYGRAELGMTIAQPGPGGTTADFAFPPRRDEAGSTMTLRFQLAATGSRWYVVDVPIAAGQHTDPNLRDGGPIDPATPAFVVSPTSTPDLVSYVDARGARQTADIQAVLDGGHKVVELAPGAYRISKPLMINAGMILRGAGAGTELDFAGLPAAIPGGIFNLNASHITLDGFKVRFLDARVNFTGEHAAIIVNQDVDQRARVDLNVLNLDIVAPATTAAVDPNNRQVLAVATTFFDTFNSGTIRGNTVVGGTIAVQGGPWLIANNRVLGAVAGTLNLGAFAAKGAHDVTLADNVVSNADPARGGLIDRFFVTSDSGYGYAITGNVVGPNVGVAAAVPGGSPSTPVDPRNNREVILFEDYGKIYEGSVNAIGVSGSAASGDARRVLSIPRAELALFSGYYWAGRWAVTILNGPDAGSHVSVIQAFPSATDPANAIFLLDAPLPAGSYDLSIQPAYARVTIANNTVDTAGTVSTALVFASSMVDATVTGNTFAGDRSAELDGHGNLEQSQAIRFNPYKASLSRNYLHQDGTDESYNVLAVQINGNTIVDAVGGVQAYLEVNQTLATTAGRTYGFLDLRDNQFRYSYANPRAIVVGNAGDYARPVNNAGAVVDPSARNFVDPSTIRVAASGNTVVWTGGAAPATDTVVNGATVNGTRYGGNVALALLTGVGGSGTGTGTGTGGAVPVAPPAGVRGTVGITADANPSAGAAGLDGAGNTYSADALGSAGGTISWRGQAFNVGAPGSASVVSLGGVGIPLPPGKYATMLLLGAATYGAHPVRLVVHYTDGTAATFDQTFSDWAGGSTAPGETVVATTPYFNSARGGRQAGTRSLYGYSFALDPTRTVAYLETSNDDRAKLVALDLVPAAAAPAPVLGDPGFEAVAVGSGWLGYRYGPTGSAWAFDAGAGLSGNGSAFTAGNPVVPGGGQVAFLQGTGTITQAVTFAAAGTYQLTFLAAQRAAGPYYNLGGQDFQVAVDGVVVARVRPAGTAYQAFATASFAATAGAHAITFRGIDSAGGDNTAFLDAVALVPAAPPAAPTLGDAGFEAVRPANGYAYNPAGSAWTFSTPGPDTGSGVTGNNSGFTNANPDAIGGRQVAFLQSRGVLSQAINFGVGGTYQIGFLAAHRAGYGVEDFQVRVDGVAVGTFAPATAWYQALTTGTFTVAAGVHTIAFVGLDTGGGDRTAFLDDILITPATAPAITATGGLPAAAARIAIPALPTPTPSPTPTVGVATPRPPASAAPAARSRPAPPPQGRTTSDPARPGTA